ncbi:MAG: hypothetical protein IJK31_00375 [Ruminococcus sp.]|nr:hypothetical protein [Ruminococcus sp.]
MKDNNKRKVTTRIVTNYTPSDDAVTEIVYSGNVTELKTIDKISTQINRYKHISKTEYFDTKTGEVLEYQNNANPNKKRNLNKTFEKLRHLINNNFQSNINELHVVLTYSEKMEDFDKASNDFKKFWNKLNYMYPDLDYIRIIEPQHTGTWHIHVLIKSAKKGYLFIPKDELEKSWGNGYAWVDKIKDNDNIGAYFWAQLKNIDVFEKESEKPNDTKCIVKGARLHFYPKGKRFYSYSKGIKKPLHIRTTYDEAKKMVNFDDCVFKTAMEIILTVEETDEQIHANTILRVQLNSKRKKKS